jgi:hypothetical protein
MKSRKYHPMLQVAGLGGSVRGMCDGLTSKQWKPPQERGWTFLTSAKSQEILRVIVEHSTTYMIGIVEIIFAFKVQWLQYHLLGTGKYTGAAQGWFVSDVMHVKSNVT